MRVPSAQRCPVGTGWGRETPEMGKASLILDYLQAPNVPRSGEPTCSGWLFQLCVILYSWHFYWCTH